jgi:hypothetical protein
MKAQEIEIAGRTSINVVLEPELTGLDEVVVTTKKGIRNKGLGITVNSSMLLTSIDKTTLPKYQKEYGANYGPGYDSPDGNFILHDFGDGIEKLTVPTGDDASWGAKFDPNLMVVQWQALDPLASNYGVATPWVFPDHSIEALFKTGVKYTNNIAFDAGKDRQRFLLGIPGKENCYLKCFIRRCAGLYKVRPYL